MERKEFSSVEEAIEALNEIKNIDYSSVEGVSELTEREFYSKLMNNFMGTRNLNFTKEERENYKAALRKKGLITYSEWKARQQPTDTMITWKDAAKQAALDAPVNTFSHVLIADDEEKFELIRNKIIKTGISRYWVENNNKIIDKIREEKQEVVDTTVTEKNENVEQSEFETTFDIENFKKDYEINKDMYSAEEPVKEEFKFSTPEEAIDALKSIEKIEYKVGTEIELAKEREFYSQIMKNLMACSDLKFDDSQAYRYQHTLQNLGCKEKSKLNKIREIDDSIALPEEYINSILQARKADHYQKFKDAKFKVKNNEDLKKWLEDAENKIEITSESENEKEKEKALVPFKKPSLFKRITTYAKLAAAGVATIFGVGKAVEQVAVQVNDDANVKKESTDLGVETPDDVLSQKFKNIIFESPAERKFASELDRHVKEEAKLKLETEPEEIKVEETEKEKETEKETEVEFQSQNVYEVSTPSYSSGDINYTKTPDDHAEVTGEANKKAKEEQEKEQKKSEEEVAAVEKAQKEAEENAIEVVIPETTVENVTIIPETEVESETKVEESIFEDVEIAPIETEFVEIETAETSQQEVQVEETQDEHGREKVEIEIDF